MVTDLSPDDRIKRLAQWYYDRLHQDTRTNGDKFYKFCKAVSPDGKGDESLPKDEEERCRALAFAVHGEGDMLPDDWKYAFINEALSAIADASGDLDEVEIEADIYNHELTSWLGSHGHRPGYCDQAAEDGLVGADADMITRISVGQYTEKREVLQAVLSHLRDEAEEEAQADEDAAAEAEALAEATDE